jgi:hypothetical protein
MGQDGAMAWFLVPLAVIVLLAVPFFGADSRDGADRKPLALRGPARRTRRTTSFSQSPGAMFVRTVASRVPGSHRSKERTRSTNRTSSDLKIARALGNRVAER